jgi:uncharacterized protein YdeI (YjbR/CyaY-like superfamily)
LSNYDLNPKVDKYLMRESKWKNEIETLRMIILECGLTEELKWGKPCYTFQNSNVVILQEFKEYCAMMFFKGALLKDPQGILVKPGDNSHAARQIRFTHVKQLQDLELTIKKYIQEAVEVEKAGLQVEVKKVSEYTMPKELLDKFEEIPKLKEAFESLTPGRQKAYILYFSKAKQSKTRQSRIEKYIPHILNGKGLND